MKENSGKKKVICVCLKSAREKKGYSIKQISDLTGIAESHVRALESCEYDKLPEGSARKTIVKNCARVLEINENELEEQMEELDCEQKIRIIKKIKWKPAFSISHIARVFAIVLFITGLIVYICFEIQTMIGPPKLIINYPPQNFETNIGELQVSGTTEPESNIAVNGLKTNINSNGDFKETIHLSKGLNLITITSQTKRGGKAVESRAVFYQP